MIRQKGKYKLVLNIGKGRFGLRNCKGYVYLELMAAFSICILLALAILPILEEVLTQRKDIPVRTEAHHLLYERLTAFMDGEIQAVGQEIIYKKEALNCFGRTMGISRE